MYQVRLILFTTYLYLFILPLFKMADADKNYFDCPKFCNSWLRE